jgi:hypothetical protein
MAQDLRSILMEMLAANVGGRPMPDLKAALIKQMGENSSELTLSSVLEKLVAQSSQRLSESGRSPGPEEGTPKMRWLLGAAREQLELLQARHDELASALGACILCWGEDAVCKECGGRGRPGWSKPDAVAFALWVEPAVKRMNSSSSASNGGRESFPQSDRGTKT